MPKLTLRDMFAVVTIVAILFAWWADHRRLEREKTELFGELLPLKMADFRARQHAAFQRQVERCDRLGHSK
jgi:hypothetical protein